GRERIAEEDLAFAIRTVLAPRALGPRDAEASPPPRAAGASEGSPPRDGTPLPKEPSAPAELSRSSAPRKPATPRTGDVHVPAGPRVELPDLAPLLRLVFAGGPRGSRVP